MYNRFQLAKKFLHYYLTASNGKGHGIHSPFVFDFITNVLNDKKNYECYYSIEKLRKELLHDKRIITVEDFGAGSSVIPFKQKSDKRYCQLPLQSQKNLHSYYSELHIIINRKLL